MKRAARKGAGEERGLILTEHDRSIDRWTSQLESDN